MLLVTGDAGESYETLYAIHRFAEAGIQAQVAAPSVRRLHLVMHDFEPGWDTYVERPGYGWTSDLAIADAKADDYTAILILGGRAPEYLRHHAPLLDLVRTMAAQGKLILALCHGIQVLVAAGLVKDRQVTCYEHVRLEVEQAGGTWCQPEAVRDGQIITGQTWGSHPEFYRLVFQALLPRS
ncbi:MAG: DJ-1/PfpI family protein [Bryobacter sp.]|nr:DJ-1/PfpI family protein [Bryobacter sp.]